MVMSGHFSQPRSAIALRVAGELVAVHRDVGQEAAGEPVQRLRLGLLERDVVAVEVGPGGVARGCRPRPRPG